MDVRSEQIGFYITATVIVDGALETEVELLSFEELQTFITEAALASVDGLPTEVYALFHDHVPDSECVCLQYLQDHGPHCTFNIEEPDESPD